MAFSVHPDLLDPLKIIAAGAVLFTVSALWISPLLFGKSWMRLSGFRIGDLRPGMVKRNAIGGFVLSLIAALLLNVLAQFVPPHSRDFFYAVGFIWLFIMLVQMNHMLWERQPFALFLLHTLRSLASLMAGAALLYFWS